MPSDGGPWPRCSTGNGSSPARGAEPATLQQQTKPSEGTLNMPATLKLTRHLIGVQIRRGKFDVLVDGTGVASIDAHETIETPVEPGHHTLQLRYGRYSSRTAAFDAAEGQVVAFRCGEKRFLPIFLASFVVPSLAIPLRHD